MNSMLRLKNIVIKNNIASADYFPECGSVHGHIELDTKSEAILSIRTANGFGQSYIAHAIFALIEMSNNNDQRSERQVMWY